MARSSGLQVRSPSGKKTGWQLQERGTFFAHNPGAEEKNCRPWARRHIRHIRPCRYPSACSRAGCPDGVRGSPHISPISCPVPSMKHGLGSYPLAKVAGRATAREPGRSCHRKSSPPWLGISSSTRLKARHMEQPRTNYYVPSCHLVCPPASIPTRSALRKAQRLGSDRRGPNSRLTARKRNCVRRHGATEHVGPCLRCGSGMLVFVPGLN